MDFGEYRINKKDFLALTSLLLLLIIIPLGVSIVKQKQILKSKATTDFNIGVNVVGITHYGYPEQLPYATSGQVDIILSAIRDMGGKVIRVFVANDRISDEEAARRLDMFLTKAASYNISVIVAFINFYGDTFYRPQGTEQFYTDSWNNIPLLNYEFFNSGYKDRYLTFIRTVISANKRHSNIYAWEPGNELKYDKNPQVFLNFMKDVTSTIKSLDPAHPVATGMIGAGHTALAPEALYPYLPNVDIITVHAYNGDRAGVADVNWARANGKRVIVEEAGISGSGNRSNSLKQEIDYWKSLGASAFLQWGFLAKGMGDNGNGDSNVGMDTIWHTDYDQLFALFTSYNGSSGDITPPFTPIPTTQRTTPTLTPYPTVPVITHISPTQYQSLPTSTPQPTSTPVPRSLPTPTLIFTPIPTPTPFPYDLSHDGKVNSIDVSLFLGFWRSGGKGSKLPIFDFNSDGVINSIDYSLLLKNYSF